MNKRPKIQVAIPDSSLSDDDMLREKTLKIGRFARAFSIFGVEEIIIFRDMTEKKNKSDTLLLKLVLDFLNTPQYLRKRLYPMNNNLSYVGLLPPIRAPQHKKRVRLKDVKQGDIRIGLLYETEYMIPKSKRNGLINEPRFHDLSNETCRFLAEVGLAHPIPFMGHGVNGEKVILKLIDSYPNLKTVRASTSDLTMKYLGYNTTILNSLEDYCNTPVHKTFVIYTSKKGKFIKNEESKFKENIKRFENLLLVFGSPNKGIDQIFPNFHKTINSVYLNMFPSQQTETIRLDEAIFGCLSIINHFLN